MPLPLNGQQDQSIALAFETDKLAAECGGDLRGIESAQSSRRRFAKVTEAEERRCHRHCFSCCVGKSRKGRAMRSGVSAAEPAKKVWNAGAFRNKSY